MTNEESKAVAPQNTTPDNQQPAAKKPPTAEEHLTRVAKGKITLLQPIRAADQDITELRWNFRNLSGWEYADAMDCDQSGGAFRITNRQALALFAASAAKETTIRNDKGEEVHPLDAQDIRERIGIDDCAEVIQVAAAFFHASVQVGSKRISNA